MGYPTNRPTHPRLLLLSGSPTWIDAVQAELAGMDPATHLETVASAAQAVKLLAVAGRCYTHLLLQPQLAGDMLTTLVGLTAGEDGSGVGLVVLGADTLPDEVPSQLGVQFVPQPSPGWLQRAVAAPLRNGSDGSSPAIAELRDALASTRVHARYQPIVRMSDRMPVGLEVLARFDHPVHGTMRPDLFVPQIEAAGLAATLTDTMLERAFADWPGAALQRYGLFIAVNFPLDVLLLPEALAALERRRGAAGIPADHIVIELTESRPVEHLAELRAAVAHLHALGYGLAIDDVGPDIRDHSPLLDLKFTALKLDKDVVREAPKTQHAKDFLARTIGHARRAGLAVVAEGVETPEIWARMEEAGVDQAQGFLVARPLPASAVGPWHEDWCARFTR